MVLSRGLSGIFDYSSIDEHDTRIGFAQEKGAVFLYFCRCPRISSLNQDQELQLARRETKPTYFHICFIILDVLQVKNEMLQADERRSSGWQDWGLGLGGLRGGTAEGGGIEGTSSAKVEVRESVQPSRKVANACLGGQSSWQDQESSCQGMHIDSNTDGELALDYGSEGTDLDEMLDGELNRDVSYEPDETSSMEQGEVAESRDETEQSEEVQSGAESEGEEEMSAGMHYLREIDRDYMCSSRLVVRGEYEGSVNGKVYRLVVRRRTEGTYVDWSLYNLDTAQQLLSMKGEMTYPYELTKKTRNKRGEIYGFEVYGGWAWKGWAYGFVNLSELSNSFPNDARDIHIDMMEAVFWDKEVYHFYHVCGPKCRNQSKTENVNCLEGDCGLRVWSIQIKTFTTAYEEHDLRPTSFSKKEEVQTVFMSLVRFFSGSFKLVIHEDQRIRRYDEEVIWMSPVQDRYFNDSVAGVDWRMRERAKQIHLTSVPKPAVEKSDTLARVRFLSVLHLMHHFLTNINLATQISLKADMEASFWTRVLIPAQLNIALNDLIPH